MTKFEYTTDNEAIDSSFVEGVYFNENTGDLAVDLSDDVYVYKNVPADVFKTFGTAKSAGTHYRENVKTKYGPAVHLGNFWTIDWTEVDVKQASLGTPKDLAYAANATVDGQKFDATNGGQTVFNLYSTDVNSAVANAALAAPPRRKHTVTFDVIDGNTDKSYTTEAGSVDEAVKALVEVTEMLGLEVTVRTVVTHFE